MASVVTGVDPQKRSPTIEVVNEREQTVGRGRFFTDRNGLKAMLAAGSWPQAHRSGLGGGCNGIGRHVAQRLLADGETVVDVPAKLSARARAFTTGQGRKADPVDAHSVAVVALRTPACGGSKPMTPRSRSGCSSTVVTSSAAPAPRSSLAGITYCSSWCPTERRRTCPASRPARCSTRPAA